VFFSDVLQSNLNIVNQMKIDVHSRACFSAANAFNLNSLGMTNGLGGGEGGMSSMFRGLEAIFAEKGGPEAASPHPHLAAKFAQIKQEILESSEPSDLHQHLAMGGGGGLQHPPQEGRTQDRGQEDRQQEDRPVLS